MVSSALGNEELSALCGGIRRARSQSSDQDRPARRAAPQTRERSSSVRDFGGRERDQRGDAKTRSRNDQDIPRTRPRKTRRRRVSRARSNARLPRVKMTGFTRFFRIKIKILLILKNLANHV